MKTMLTAILLTLGAATATAQDDLVARRDEKLKGEFLKKADWNLSRADWEFARGASFDALGEYLEFGDMFDSHPLSGVL